MSQKGKLVFGAVTFGGVAVASVSSITSGLFAWGQAVGIVIIIAGVGVAGIKYYWEARGSLEPAVELGPKGFGLARPSWLGEDERLGQLAKGAFFLLAFDRTEQGCWGKTYLYRRHLSKEGIPLSGGSLTGTPLALIALDSCTHGTDTSVAEWARPLLSSTLARISTEDGRYLRGHNEGQLGKVPEFEPARHAAGACLTTLLYGNVGDKVLKTLAHLRGVPIERSAWDNAIVARTLLQGARDAAVPFAARLRSRKRCKALLHALVRTAASSDTAGNIWATPYGYGVEATTQWATVWTVLPILALADTPKKLRDSFVRLIHDLLLSQRGGSSCSTPPSSGKAHRLEPGVGADVLGIGMAAVAWRMLETYGVTLPHRGQITANTKDAIVRLRESFPRLLEQPVHHPAGEPSALEGYFAWAALCLASATVGIRLSPDCCAEILKLVDEFNTLSRDFGDRETLEARYHQVIKASALFSTDTAAAVTRAAAKVSLLYGGITSDRNVEQVAERQPH